MRVLIVSADRTDAGGGAANLGDAFLTDALIKALEALGHVAVAVDFGPERTVRGEPRMNVTRIAGLFRAIRVADAVMVGGGTLLQDDDPGAGLGGLPRLCATVSWMARVARKPLVFIGVGCDPVERLVPKLLLRAAVWRRDVWVRDTASQERFLDYFHHGARLGADVALLAEPAGVEAGGRDRILLAPNLRDAPQLTMELVEGLRRHASRVSSLAMDQRLSDGDHTTLEPRVRRELVVQTSPIGWRRAQAEIADADVVMASRMHALYLAMLSGRACVAVGESAKVRAFAEEFGVPRSPGFDVDVVGRATVVSPDRLGDAVARAHSMLEEALDVLRPRESNATNPRRAALPSSV